MTAAAIKKPALDVGFFARNVPAMLRFYGEIIALEKIAERPVPLGQLHVFKVGESILKVVAPNSPRPSSGPGDMYVTLEISNVRDFYAAACDAGAEVETPLTEIPSLSFAILRDPDGNMVEVLQRTEPPARS